MAYIIITSFDIGMAYIIMGMIITSFSSSKRVKKIICLCTRLEENLFTCKISSSLELWLVRFVFSKKDDEESVKIMFYLYFVPRVIIFCMQLLFDMFSTLMPFTESEN